MIPYRHCLLFAASWIGLQGKAQTNSFPETMDVCVGDDAMFRWTSPELTSQRKTTFWYHGDTQIASRDTHDNFASIFDNGTRLQPLDGYNRGILLKNVDENDAGEYSVNLAMDEIFLSSELRIHTAERLKPDVQVNQLLLNLENDTYDFSAASSLFIVVGTLHGLTADINISVTDFDQVTCKDTKLCTANIDFTQSTAFQRELILSIDYGICGPMKYILPLPSKGDVLHTDGKIYTCTGKDVALDWTITEPKWSQVQSIEWYKSHTLIGRVKRDTDGAMSAFRNMINTKRLSRAHGTNAGIVLENVSKEDSGIYKMMTSNGIKSKTRLVVYLEEDLIPSLKINDNFVSLNQGTHAISGNFDDIYFSLLTAMGLPAFIKIHVGDVIKSCRKRTLCTTHFRQPDHNKDRNVRLRIRIEYVHLPQCPVLEYTLVVTNKRKLETCTARSLHAREAEYMKDKMYNVIRRKASYTGMVPNQGNMFHSQFWTKRPGDIEACVGHDVLFGWTFDENITEPEMTYWKFLKTDQMLLSRISDPSNQETTEYRLSNRISHEQAAGFLLKDVSVADSGNYEVVVGIDPPVMDVASLSVYPAEDFEPKIFIGSRLYNHATADCIVENSTAININITTANGGTSDISIGTNGATNTLCEDTSVCNLELSLDKYPSGEVNITLTVKHRFCSPYTSKLCVRKASNKNPSMSTGSIVGTIVALICALICAPAIGIIWMIRRRRHQHKQRGL